MEAAKTEWWRPAVTFVNWLFNTLSNLIPIPQTLRMIDSVLRAFGLFWLVLLFLAVLSLNKFDGWQAVVVIGFILSVALVSVVALAKIAITNEGRALHEQERLVYVNEIPYGDKPNQSKRANALQHPADQAVAGPPALPDAGDLPMIEEAGGR